MPITINRMAASSAGLSSLAWVPRPRKIKPTSPRGIIPSPTTSRWVGSLETKHQPATTLPAMATTSRNAATTRPGRLAGSRGLSTERSMPVPISTKKIVANRATTGFTAASIACVWFDLLRIRPAANAPSAASSPMAVAAKQQRVSTTNEATTTSPGALSRSITQSKPGAAVRLRPMAANTNTIAAATSLRIGPTSRLPPPARLTTTARITMPRMSSSTAAPITIWPSRERSIFSSPNTLAVMPMLVAVIEAPANTAGITST